MGTTSLPQIYAQLLAARGLVGPDPFEILIVGQIGALGTAVDGQYYEDVQRMTIAEIEALFGDDSAQTLPLLSSLLFRRNGYYSASSPP